MKLLMEALATEPEVVAESAVAASAAAATPAPAKAKAVASASAPTLVSTFAEMRLKVGAQISLEPPRRIVGARATAKVLGWLEGASILVTAPQSAVGRLVLQEGEPVLARAFTGKSAFAFRAMILRAAYLPFPYLHLSFPDKVEQVQIRNSFRYRVQLPATIAAGGKSGVPGRILDIGTTGALIETAGSLDQDAGPIRIAVALELHGTPVSLDLHAQVRVAKSVEQGTPHYQYGVEFKDLQGNDRLVLGSLLWYEMQEHPERAV